MVFGRNRKKVSAAAASPPYDEDEEDSLQVYQDGNFLQIYQTAYNDSYSNHGYSDGSTYRDEFEVSGVDGDVVVPRATNDATAILADLDDDGGDEVLHFAPRPQSGFEDSAAGAGASVGTGASVGAAAAGIGDEFEHTLSDHENARGVEDEETFMDENVSTTGRKCKAIRRKSILIVLVVVLMLALGSLAIATSAVNRNNERAATSVNAAQSGVAPSPDPVPPQPSGDGDDDDDDEGGDDDDDGGDDMTGDDDDDSPGDDDDDSPSPGEGDDDDDMGGDDDDDEGGDDDDSPDPPSSKPPSPPAPVPAPHPESCAYAISVSSKCYNVGDRIQVDFSACERPYAWIGLWGAEAETEGRLYPNQKTWQWTCGGRHPCFDPPSDGTVSFTAKKVGAYKVYLIEGDVWPSDYLAGSDAFRVTRECHNDGGMPAGHDYPTKPMPTAPEPTPHPIPHPTPYPTDPHPTEYPTEPHPTPYPVGHPVYPVSFTKHPTTKDPQD